MIVHVMNIWVLRLGLHYISWCFVTSINSHLQNQNKLYIFINFIIFPSIIVYHFVQIKPTENDRKIPKKNAIYNQKQFVLLLLNVLALLIF